jgi:hypothetical protein
MCPILGPKQINVIGNVVCCDVIINTVVVGAFSRLLEGQFILVLPLAIQCR